MKRQEALDILGLAPGATPPDIKRRYRQLALEHHPDGKEGMSDAYFKTLNEAYSTLLPKPGIRTAAQAAFRDNVRDTRRQMDDLLEMMGTAFCGKSPEGRRQTPFSPGDVFAISSAALRQQYRHAEDVLRTHLQSATVRRAGLALTGLFAVHAYAATPASAPFIVQAALATGASAAAMLTVRFAAKGLSAGIAAVGISTAIAASSLTRAFCIAARAVLPTSPRLAPILHSTVAAGLIQTLFFAPETAQLALHASGHPFFGLRARQAMDRLEHNFANGGFQLRLAGAATALGLLGGSLLGLTLAGHAIGKASYNVLAFPLGYADAPSPTLAELIPPGP